MLHCAGGLWTKLSRKETRPEKTLSYKIDIRLQHRSGIITRLYGTPFCLVPLIGKKPYRNSGFTVPRGMQQIYFLISYLQVVVLPKKSPYFQPCLIYTLTLKLEVLLYTPHAQVLIDGSCES